MINALLTTELQDTEENWKELRNEVNPELYLETSALLFVIYRT